MKHSLLVTILHNSQLFLNLFYFTQETTNVNKQIMDKYTYIHTKNLSSFKYKM